MLPTLEARLKDVTLSLAQRKTPYALAGGLVASLYRSENRATQDIDLAVLVEDDRRAIDLLHSLGLKAVRLTRADLEGGPLHARRSRSGPTWMVSTPRATPGETSVDLLLSLIPWVPLAIERARSNTVDFGFEEIPCLTVEDVLLSKLFSLKNRSDRFQDLDDLKNIFETGRRLDMPYLAAQMRRLGIPIAPAIVPFAPKMLLKVSKEIVSRSR